MDLPFFTIELTRDGAPGASRPARKPGRTGQHWRLLAVTLLTLPGGLGATAGGWVLAGGEPTALAASATELAADPPFVGDLISRPVPAAGFAPLHVASQPAGARVWLDGRERGRTPLDLALAPGRHVPDELRHFAAARLDELLAVSVSQSRH